MDQRRERARVGSVKSECLFFFCKRKTAYEIWYGLVGWEMCIRDRGTAAGVRVLLDSTDGSEVWSTTGVSENIIEASWQALIDSIEYKLSKDKKKK